ncbi:MAG: UDP-N-acetylglucosamine 2-epimerase (non-hydrolyzing) [Candidatus Krumholzibacteriota bacterium]|nr:UDP-N-acetylglucosamine 2-epimerase (non-hydrolyzing) [Candidatus Krumholzibacteriota bacterium]
MKKFIFIFGTRPEAIKLAPLIIEMKKKNKFHARVCVTSQHREMLDQALGFFDIVPDYDLNIMKGGQSLFEVTFLALKGLEPVLDQEKPDAVIVQGDTTSTFVGSLAAYYKKTRVVHVEAGLRSGDKYNPFPEEQFRRMADTMADWCFAPTESAAENLRKENIAEENIFITGNTGIDALLMTVAKIESDSMDRKLEEKFAGEFGLDWNGDRTVLVTIHRRESFGRDLIGICEGIEELAGITPHTRFIWPLHPNPRVNKPVQSRLGSVPNVHLIPPLDYSSFVWLMKRSYLIMTDSGGIQEEAPSIGKPVMVLREKTERPEGIEIGTARLTGVNKDKIVKDALLLLQNESAYLEMARRINPYGDGKASQKIVKILEKKL